jgi:hypothetical protein
VAPWHRAGRGCRCPATTGERARRPDRGPRRGARGRPARARPDGSADASRATLAIGAEDADPATSRALLDLTDVAIGVSGPAFVLALAGCGLAIRRAPGTLPAPIAGISLLAAACTLLWGARLLSDNDSLVAGSFAGSTLGWVALLVWTASAGLWLATGHGLAPPPAPGGRPPAPRFPQ